MILNPEPPRAPASRQLSSSGLSPWQLGMQVLTRAPTPLFELGRHSKSVGHTRGYFRSPISRRIIRWFLHTADPNKRYNAADVKSALFSDEPEMTIGGVSKHLASLSGTSSTILYRTGMPKYRGYLTYRYSFNRNYNLDLIPWAK